MKAIGVFFALYLSFLTTPVSAQRQASADFDADGFSDFVLIQANRNVLSWSALKSDGSQQSSLGEFGRLGFHIVLGDWLGSGMPQPATVTDSKGELIWRIFSQGVSISQSFGQAGDTAVAGADFNQDGIVDAATVTTSTKQLLWRINTQLFLNNLLDLS